MNLIVVVSPGAGGHEAAMQYVIAALIGLAGGVASGLFGVGGGIVMVPAMMYLMNLDIKLAIGTSLVVIVPTAISGLLQHQRLGHVDWRVAASIIPLAIIGGYVGARLTGPLHAETLKKLFGGFMILAGLRLVVFK